MDYILGLDLGASSLGWAVIEARPLKTGRWKPRRLVDAGVRIFDAGVEGEIEKGKDSSRASQRRQARQPRRQHWRRQHRKRKLFELLQRHGLLPASESSSSEARQAVLEELDKQLADKHLVDADHLGRQKLAYIMRARAAEEPVEPHELGRALYHLAGRRGFLSSRKGQDDEETEGKVRSGISELAQAIGEHRTLGQFYAREVNVLQPRIDSATGQSDAKRGRIRQRYTSRDMYRDEFKAIREAQKNNHALPVSDDAWQAIDRAIFHQRPLKSQRHLIGRCTLEPNRPRCPEALPIFQRFRILQMVNDLKVVEPGRPERFLNAEERKTLNETLQREASMTFPQIRKLLELPTKTVFPLAEWETRVVGHRTNAKMIDIFGERWSEFSEEEQERITLDILHYLKPQALVRRAMKEWGLEHEAAQVLARLRMEEGYASLSKQAMRKLTAAMQDGTPYATARKKVYPLSFDAAEAEETLMPVNEWNKDIRNPAVIRSLTELRKVVHALIRKYGKPSIIRIEMTRDLKNSRDRRKEIWKHNDDRRKRREKAVEEMQKQIPGHHPSETDKLKWLLAEECNWQCPYTERPIDAYSLIVNPQFDIEHIYPRRFLDDSLTNKTLCYHEENRHRKRNLLPFHAYAGDPIRWEEILTRVAAFQGPLAREKLKRFQTQEVPDDFVSKHLDDTRRNTRYAADYLGTLFGGRVDEAGNKRIFTPTGGLSWMLRRGWQLDGMLSTEGVKTRDDHRHHAIDAIVVALSDDAHVQALAETAEKADRFHERGQLYVSGLELPWDGFNADVRDVIERINVSHRTTQSLAGPLHKESIYSKSHRGRDGRAEHRIRKELHKLTAKEISGDQIVDATVRAMVQQKFADLGGGQPNKVFADPTNHPQMTTSDGRKIPIHKVRLVATAKPRAIGQGTHQRFVAAGPDSNFASMIYAVLDKQGREKKWVHKIITRLEAHEMLSAWKGKVASKGEEKVLISDEQNGKRRFKFALHKNDCLLLEGPEGNDVLYRVQKLSTGEIQLSPVTRISIQGSDRNPWNQIRNIDRLRTRNARPVTVSPIGEVIERRS